MPRTAVAAVSRELPQPKFSPAIRICAPWRSGSANGSVSKGDPSGAKRSGSKANLTTASPPSTTRAIGVMTSVSMLSPRSTTARERTISGNGSLTSALRRRRYGRGWLRPPRWPAGQVGTRARTLPADEVAVRGGDASLAARHDVAVHGDAHGASRLAPLEAGLAEHLVQAEALGGALHALRARHHDRADAVGDPPSGDDRRRGLQIAQAAIGARAMKTCWIGVPASGAPGSRPM